MKTVEYTCEHCGGTYHEPSREEEVVTEFRDLFGDEPLDTESRARVCEKCWIEIMTAAEQEGIIDSSWRRYIRTDAGKLADSSGTVPAQFKDSDA
jgi:hypothetical protein